MKNKDWLFCLWFIPFILICFWISPKTMFEPQWLKDLYLFGGVISMLIIFSVNQHSRRFTCLSVQ